MSGDSLTVCPILFQNDFFFLIRKRSSIKLCMTRFIVIKAPYMHFQRQFRFGFESLQSLSDTVYCKFLFVFTSVVACISFLCMKTVGLCICCHFHMSYIFIETKFQLSNRLQFMLVIKCMLINLARWFENSCN